MPTTPATRKPTRATTRTATTHKPDTAMPHKPAPPAPKTSVDYLEEVLKDLGKAREKGGKEIRASIDAAMEWVRQAAKELGSRSQGQVGGWQKALDAATDDVLRELGLMTIRAQHSPEVLTEFSAEIRKRRGQLSRRATADRRRAAADRVTP